MSTKRTTDIFSITFGWSNILEYLSYIDICNLGALTNQNLTSIILEGIENEASKNKNKKQKSNLLMKTNRIVQYANKSMPSTLKKYLSYFGLDFKTFFKRLKKLKGIIAGGFALSIYTGNLNDNSDIDIYLPYSFSIRDRLLPNKFEDYLKSYGYDPIVEEINSYEKKVLTFENILIKRKIQLILNNHPENESIFPHLIINNFDLTICMCFIKSYGDKKYEFYSQHMNHLLNKTMKVNKLIPLTIKFAQKTIPRIIKYQTRGIHFIDGEMILQNFWKHEIKVNKKHKLKKNKLYIYIGINITYTILRFCYSNELRFYRYHIYKIF